MLLSENQRVHILQRQDFEVTRGKYQECPQWPQLFRTGLLSKQIGLRRNEQELMQGFFGEIRYTPWRPWATDFSNLQGRVLHLSMWACVYVKREEQRGNTHPWKPLGLSSCQVSLGFSLHLQDLDVFCPWASHHAWLIHPELPAASSQDAVQARMLMEIPARRGYVGKETPRICGEGAGHMDGRLP